MSGQARYQVGQEVYVRDVNERGREPHMGRVTKVGRSLVYVEEWGRTKSFRIEDGRVNDSYGHFWLETPQEYEDGKRRDALVSLLRQRGVSLERGAQQQLPPDAMQRILNIVSESPGGVA